MRTHTLALVPLVAAALALPGAALAQAPELPTEPAPKPAQERVRGLVRFAGEHGGDQVMQFEYDDGSTPDVIAGGGILLMVGGAAEAFRSGPHALEAQASVGLKYRTIPPASNQEATWLRFPVEGLLFYKAPTGIRVGGGVTTHLRNVLSASGEVADGRVEFQATPGMVLQVDYQRGSVGFDVRYTSLDYKVEGEEGSVDASSVGVGVSWFFRPRSRAATPAATPAP